MTNRNITDFPMDNYYAKWVNYEPFENNKKKNIGIGIIDTSSTNINENLVDSNNKITRDMIVTGLSSLIKSAVTSVMKSNSDGILGIIRKTVEMSMKTIRGKGSFSTSVSRRPNPNEDPARVINNIQIKLTSSLVQIIDVNIANQYNNMKSLAPNMGGIINSVIKSFSNIDNKAVDKALALGHVLIKSVILSGKSKIENINFIKNTLELNDRFEIISSLEFDALLKYRLDSKNFSKCIESIETGVDFDLNNTELTDAQKNIIISSIIDCLFNQKVLMELSNYIIDSINNIITSASNSISDNKFRNHLYSGIVGTAVIFASFGQENKDSMKLSVVNKESKPQKISIPQTLNRYLDTDTNTNVPEKQNKPISQEPKILEKKMLKEKNNESVQCPECIQKPCECTPVICKECPKCPDCNISLKKEIQNCQIQYEGTISNLYIYIYILLLFVFIFGYMVFQ
jgi:hypothetical protein